MVSDFTQRRHYWAGAAAGLLFLGVLLPLNAQTPAAIEPPIVLSGGQAMRLLITQEAPDYPALARVNYIEGQVHVEMLISDAGRVARAHVMAGNPVLAAAALRAVQHWVYRPLSTVKGPTAFLTTVNLNFTLRAKGQGQRPTNPERDFARQVKPPSVLGRVVDPDCTNYVRMRVLLNDRGQVIDAQPLQGPPPEFEGARKTVEHWTFSPAQWGTMHLPWYLEVDVPVADPTVRSVAAGPAAR